MKDERVVVGNVQAFLDKTCDEYGRMKAAELSSFAAVMIRSELKSPIEDLFFIAFCAQAEAELQDLNPPYVRGEDGKFNDGKGVHIKPQFKIGPYRADFLIYQNGLTEDPCMPTVIELDGHAFHERDKHERAYEKFRDRFFVKHGYRILHFTGSEVVADPHKVAFEALSLIGAVYSGREYDPKFPLGEWQ